MSKQASIYNFFSKSQASKKLNSGEKARNNVKLKGTSVGEHDLVWAKLEGYPWWPALVCHSPSENVFLKNNKIHVQFFDDPPTRGWVKEMLVKAYCPVGENGIPSYKDPMWIKAVKEANKAKTMDKKERGSLIVQMVPSDEEEEEEDVVAMETDDDKDDDDDSDRSKENIGVNGTKNKRRKKGTENSDGGEPLKKRRRIILCSDSESEDDYKPGKESESEDDSGSSGVDEDQVSGLETESEVDSPVKTPKTKSKRPVVVASSELKSLTSSPSSSATRAPSTPKVSSATKSSLAAFAAKDAAPSSNTGEGGGEDWPFLHYPWLLPENIRDRNQRRPDHPDYNKRTLYVPDTFLNKQTPGMRQWWELKSCHNDTVLFFKMGKFYELFHMDALLGVQELGLLMMKGDNAHAGFPEIAYGRYSATLIDKGYKVARIEQTETPEMMEKRCKSMARASKFDRVVRREVCQVTTKATRVYSFLDGEDAQAATSHLLALTERSTSGAVEGCEFGVAFVDTSTGLFHLGQFVDDRHLSRLRTLLAHYPADQILVERGKLSQKTNTLVNATVSPGLKEVLTPEKEFWGAGKTLSFLADGPYFHSDPRESESRGEDDKERETKGKKDKGKSGGVNWPEELKLMLDDGDVLELTARGDCELAVSSLGGLIWYLQECHLDEQLLTRRMMSRYQPQDNALLATTPESPPKNNRSPATTRHYMVLDGITLRNLEVFENSSGGTEGTLMDRLDRCSTPFGKRLLRRWLCAPLCQSGSINARLQAVTDLRGNPDTLYEVSQLLKTLPDLERILAKIHTQGLKCQSSHPDTRAIFFEDVKYNRRKVMDFLAALGGFQTTLDILTAFKGVLGSLTSSLLKSCVTTTEEGGKFPPIQKTLKFFDNAFDHSEAKREGKIIPCPGVDMQYDTAVSKIKDTKDQLALYLKEQCTHFGSKVVYWGNDKKRYQLEVPEHACKRAGEEYELVSQKKGFKRYWTPHTRDLLADMLVAEEERNTALGDIARRIFQQFDESYKKWESVLECMSVLDVLISLARYSGETNTVAPEIVNPQSGEKPFLEILDGLHPCVVSTFTGDEFIPNDLRLGVEGHCAVTLVTGPNMGGKSTLMRQTALICLMAQLGSYVPASACKLTPVDRIFTRLGTSDRIIEGESTFLVELAETSSILQHATQHSLVLVDELGRGTASYDGTAIASGVVEALLKLGPRTLFSTHYHSLVDDFASHSNVTLGHMACMVEGENEEDPSEETITFLYKFTGGACPKSYGFNAACLADLPQEVIRQGSQKAKQLEKVNARKHTFRKLFSCTNNGSGSDPDRLREYIRKIRSLE